MENLEMRKNELEAIEMAKSISNELNNLIQKMEFSFGYSGYIDEGSEIINRVSMNGIGKNSVLNKLAKLIYSLRRMREKFIDGDLFSEPGWDIILNLFIARSEGRMLTVSAACRGGCVAPTTALRWIDRLEEIGFLRRENNPDDQRIIWVVMTDAGFEKASSLLSAIHAEISRFQTKALYGHLVASPVP